MASISSRTARRLAAGAGLLTAGVLVGGTLGGVMSASASTTGGDSSSTSTAAAQPPTGQPQMGGTSPVRSDEQEVTGAKATTLRAAALEAVPGGTVVRIETDAGDAAYEVHMTKADGTPVTVKFNASLAVLRVENGMGQGDPMPSGRPPAANGSAADGPQAGA